MNKCEFPNCRNPANGSEKYCIGHAKLMSVPKAVKQPVSIAKRSEKMKKEMAPYKKEVALFLADPKNKHCQIKAKGCTRIAVCVHHVAGRSGQKLRDKKDWKPSCNNCNSQVEEKDLQARINGHKKSRLTKVVK